MNDFLWTLAAYVPLTLVVSTALSAMSERNLRDVPRHAMKFWGTMLVFSAVALVLITLAQDPWLVL
ncbi:MAG: hypothetical protein L6Q71_11655 [Planctomycetes bacterium]|nr:hypothetical protein [Planctomycetota bacterium]NUQ34827.1 hypothetical protein [Planctomycetaceae bacterium]